MTSQEFGQYVLMFWAVTDIWVCYMLYRDWAITRGAPLFMKVLLASIMLAAGPFAAIPDAFKSISGWFRDRRVAKLLKSTNDILAQAEARLIEEGRDTTSILKAKQALADLEEKIKNG